MMRLRALAVSLMAISASLSCTADRPSSPTTRPVSVQRTADPQKPGWTLTFHDEFDRPTLNTDEWIAYYRNNKSLPAHYVIDDGVLHLRMDRDAPGSRGGNAGRVSGIETRRSPKSFAQQYGYFELRARCAKGSGVQSAFWLSPLDSRYDVVTSAGGIRTSPREATEIDIFEQHGKEPRGNNFTVHYGSPAGHGSDARHVILPIDLTDDFHVFGFEWTRDTMIWTVDGSEVHRSDKVPHHPFFIRLSLYEGDSEWRGKVNPTDP